MKLMPFQTNDLFAKAEVTDGAQVFKEAWDAINSFKNLLQDVQPWSISTGHDEEDYKDMQLDTIEGTLFELDYPMFERFVRTMSGATDPIQRRGKNALHYLEQAQEILSKLSSTYIPLTTEQETTVQELCKHVISELVFFLYYQYNIAETQESVAKGEDALVNVAFNMYCDQEGHSVVEVVKEMQELMKQYRPEFTVFETNPELEDEFYNIAGAYIKDFEVLSEYLTLDIVQGIIEGRYEAENVIKDLEKSIEASEAEEEEDN